jgi:antitoxin component YwqK of YwqJK toxin-antitoxin module
MERASFLEQKYPTNEGYAFKSCSAEWIVILKKLEDTKTNESRVDVKNSIYAKFRANKLFVVDIIHKLTDQTTNEITNSVYTYRKITYKKGEIVEIYDFDTNLNDICSSGIHYFQKADAAFYYELPVNYTGLYKEWYDNGQLEIECAYKNGILNGTYQLWYGNGQLEMECTYKDGKKDGLRRKLYENGQLKVECTYKDGKYDGLYKEWFPNGQLKVECTFKDGLCKKWDTDDQLIQECTYKSGELDGLCKMWHENGQLIQECTYKDGKTNDQLESEFVEKKYSGTDILNSDSDPMAKCILAGGIGLGIYFIIKYFKSK